jgi:uncharacterized protein (TIGR02996 family)
MAKREQPADPLRAALEAALVADPDDLAAHSAYADWLSEQADEHLRAKGEFIQVQLALEGDPKPAAAKALRQREQALLARHRDEWLGPLAPMFRPGDEPRQFARFARGWIDSVRVNLLNVAHARLMAKAEELKLLRSLIILGCENEYEGTHYTQNPRASSDVNSACHYPALSALATARNLGNVRVFGLGDCEGDCLFCTYPDSNDLIDVLPLLTRLRELHLNVRGLNEYSLMDEPVVLGLHTLRLERARLRNDGARALAGWKWRNLRVLQIWNGWIGNAGAKALATSQRLRGLELLDLSFNHLTRAGIDALKALRGTVVAEYQMRDADDLDDEYTHDGWGGAYNPDDDPDEFDDFME